MRWQHPDGMRMPAEFLDLLSDTRTAKRFVLWQIDAAIEDAARWPGLRVSLNATPEYLISPDAGLNLLKAIQATGLRPEQFTIEVIEWAIIKQEETARKMLTMLKEAGVKIALDDFGSGYASAKYLSMFPFDYVKIDRIDRTFIVEMSRGRSGYVEALALMAHRLGIESLAEGVETEAEVAAARAGLHDGSGVPLRQRRCRPTASTSGCADSPLESDQTAVNNAALPLLGGATSYSVNAGGSLTALEATAELNGRSDTCWIEITDDGRFLFASNFQTGDISSYTVGSDGTLTLLNPVAARVNAPLPGSFDLALVGSDLLYALDTNLGTVVAYRIDGSGGLSEIDRDRLGSLPGAFGLAAT